MKPILAAAAATLLAACATMTDEPLRATAQLQPTKGNKTFGEATFEQVGDCGSGDGMSTKGHFNPFGKPHAHAGTPERHAGDLPALKAAKNGRAKVDAMLDIITVGPGPASIVGRGLIVHADPDDYRTQPTGNAGARIACGVIQPG